MKIVYIWVTLDDKDERVFHWHDGSTGYIPPKPEKSYSNPHALIESIKRSFGTDFIISPGYPGSPSEIAFQLTKREIDRIKAARGVFQIVSLERINDTEKK